MPLDPNIDYEHLPPGEEFDETDVNLRSYFCKLSDDKLAEYDSSWSDDQVVEWDGNFKDDGNLFMVCCERDVDIDEYRAVLKEHLKHRPLEPSA